MSRRGFHSFILFSIRSCCCFFRSASECIEFFYPSVFYPKPYSSGAPFPTLSFGFHPAFKTISYFLLLSPRPMFFASSFFFCGLDFPFMY